MRDFFLGNKVSFCCNTTSLNLEFSFSQTGCQTKAKESSLLYYLSLAWVCVGGGIDVFMPYKRTLAQSQTQAALFKIWTPVVDSISNDYNFYA